MRQAQTGATFALLASMPTPRAPRPARPAQPARTRLAELPLASLAQLATTLLPEAVSAAPGELPTSVPCSCFLAWDFLSETAEAYALTHLPAALLSLLQQGRVLQRHNQGNNLLPMPQGQAVPNDSHQVSLITLLCPQPVHACKLHCLVGTRSMSTIPCNVWFAGCPLHARQDTTPTRKDRRPVPLGKLLLVHPLCLSAALGTPRCLHLYALLLNPLHPATLHIAAL